MAAAIDRIVDLAGSSLSRASPHRLKDRDLGRERNGGLTDHDHPWTLFRQPSRGVSSTLSLTGGLSGSRKLAAGFRSLATWPPWSPPSLLSSRSSSVGMRMPGTRRGQSHRAPLNIPLPAACTQRTSTSFPLCPDEPGDSVEPGRDSAPMSATAL